MGNFGTVPRGTYGQLCPKPPPVLTPRVHMGPIVRAAVPRRSAERPSPRSLKDVPSDLSLRNFIPYSRFSASLASFSRCTLSNSACVASCFCCILSKSALKAATSSSDRRITPWLAVPAPRRCLSYILLRYLVPDGHQKRLDVPPDSQMCTSPLWSD